MKIEEVTVEDAKKLLEIYRPYIEKTAITFEVDVPSINEFEHRIKTISSKYPYLKLIDDNKIVGYAYANTFKERKAYQYDVEVSVYLDENKRGNGYGKALYDELENRLIKQGIKNVCACIAMPLKETEYLTEASYHFHLKMGYELIGRFKHCAYKFNEWFDMIWMGKQI